MKYLHTMVRVTDIEASLNFYCKLLGLVEVGRHDSEPGRFTLVFLAAPGNRDDHLERPCGGGNQRVCEAVTTIGRATSVHLHVAAEDRSAKALRARLGR